MSERVFYEGVLRASPFFSLIRERGEAGHTADASGDHTGHREVTPALWRAKRTALFWVGVGRASAPLHGGRAASPFVDKQNILDKQNSDRRAGLFSKRDWRKTVEYMVGYSFVTIDNAA